MFIILKDCPRVLFRKMALTALIGLGCFVVGIAYYLFAHDGIFLALSGLVLLFSLWRGYGVYAAIAKGKYEVVEGTCVGVTAKPLRKYNKVRIMDTDGNETTVCLGKQVKLKIGMQYRLYFKQVEHADLNSEYFNSALLSDQFLGLEALGEFSQ